MKEFLKSLFYIDLRSLALYRISLGTLLLCDLYNRVWYLRAHYTDFGLLPRGALLEKFISPVKFSFHFMSGSTEFQAFLFILHALFAILMIVGFRSRLFTFLSWLFLVSLQNRNRMVLQGGDVLFRMLFFWAMFLPLGRKYSVDEALNLEDSSQIDTWSFASTGLLLQVVFVYWFTIMFKYAPEWRSEFTAVYYALSIDQFTTPLGKWLLELKALHKPLTILTFLVELIPPLMVFFPFRTWFFRLTAVILLIGLHLSFAACMKLGLFPWISSVSWLVFLPTEFWSGCSKFFKSKEKEALKIYYDGGCEFCLKIVRILKVFLHLPESQILSAQVNPETRTLLERENSWIVETSKGERFFGFEGLTQVFLHSPLFSWIGKFLSLPSIQILGDSLYKGVAKNRKTLSKISSHMKFYREKEYRPSKTLQASCATLLVLVTLYNISSLDHKPIRFPKKLSKLMHLLRFDQKWRMFSPKPSVDDGWYVIPGTLADGSEVNVLDPGEPLPWEKPELVSSTYPSQRWRKYMMNIRRGASKKYRLYFGKWLCRRWNEGKNGDDRLNRFQIHFMRERTEIEKPMKIKKLTLWRHKCFDKDLEKEYWQRQKSLKLAKENHIRFIKEVPRYRKGSRNISSKE